MSFRLRRWVALGWLALLLLAALLAPTTTPDLQHSLLPPSAAHWLGTDALGQDVWTMVLAGARTTCMVSLPAALLSVLLGGVAGSAAGFWGNERVRIRRAGAAGAAVATAGMVLFWGQILAHAAGVLVVGLLPGLLVAAALQRTRWGRRSVALPLDSGLLALIALLDSVPLLILVLAVAAVQRPTPLGLVALLTLTCWTVPARLLRSVTLQVRARPFVEAATAAGIPAYQVLGRHIWPNTWRVLLVRLPLSVALIIGLETTLSFLGVGLPPEVASWGRLIASTRLAPAAWWLLLGPGISLVATILSLQTLAQSIQGLRNSARMSQNKPVL